MSRVFQRTGRTGYYLGLAVPRSLRSQNSKSEVVRKLGNTHKAAIAIHSKVESEIQREFGAALNTLTLVEKIHNTYNQASLRQIKELKAAMFYEDYFYFYYSKSLHNNYSREGRNEREKLRKNSEVLK